MNSVNLIGNLGADPVLRTTPSGKSVCNLRVAVDDRVMRTGEDGARTAEKRVDWIPVVVWGKQAEVCKEQLRKGRLVGVEGALRSRSWEDEDGNKRSALEIVASNVRFLDAPKRAVEQA